MREALLFQGLEDLENAVTLKRGRAQDVTVERCEDRQEGLCVRGECIVWYVKGGLESRGRSSLWGTMMGGNWILGVWGGSGRMDLLMALSSNG